MVNDPILGVIKHLPKYESLDAIAKAHLNDAVQLIDVSPGYRVYELYRNVRAGIPETEDGAHDFIEAGPIPQKLLSRGFRCVKRHRQGLQAGCFDLVVIVPVEENAIGLELKVAVGLGRRIRYHQHEIHEKHR